MKRCTKDFDYVDIDRQRILKETEKAYLILQANLSKEHGVEYNETWVSKSICKVKDGVVYFPEWVAIKGAYCRKLYKRGIKTYKPNENE